MKRSLLARPKLRLILFLLIALLAYFGYKYLFSAPLAQPADVFMVSSDLVYGDTIIEGTLHKNTATGKAGEFVLTLADSRPIVLDVAGLDSLLGLNVLVSGYLTPASGINPMSMQVNSIEVSPL